MYWNCHLIPSLPPYDLFGLSQLIKGCHYILIREFIEFRCRLLGYFWLPFWVDPQSHYSGPFFWFGLSESLRHPLSCCWYHLLSSKPPLETMPCLRFQDCPGFLLFFTGRGSLLLQFFLFFPFFLFPFNNIIIYSLQLFYCTFGNSVKGHIEVLGKILQSRSLAQ